MPMSFVRCAVCGRVHAGATTRLDGDHDVCGRCRSPASAMRPADRSEVPDDEPILTVHIDHSVPPATDAEIAQWQERWQKEQRGDRLQRNREMQQRGYAQVFRLDGHCAICKGTISARYNSGPAHCGCGVAVLEVKDGVPSWNAHAVRIHIAESMRPMDQRCYDGPVRVLLRDGRCQEAEYDQDARVWRPTNGPDAVLTAETAVGWTSLEPPPELPSLDGYEDAPVGFGCQAPSTGAERVRRLAYIKIAFPFLGGHASGSPVGWLPILEQACVVIATQPGAEHIGTGQVKEKFGTLRWYLDRSTAAARAAVRLAEVKSAFACSVCGAGIEAGTRTRDPDDGHHWVITLCDAHAEVYRDGVEDMGALLYPREDE